MKTTLHRWLWLGCLLVLLTGMNQAQAFYNPTTGRWLSRDPIGERGGLNLVGFVANDAVNATDGSGLISSLNFASVSELAWMLGGSAAFDASLSIGVQKVTRPCDDLSWKEVGKDVGVGAALTVGTFGLSKVYGVYKAAKLAKLFRQAEHLRELGRYDELAGMVARHGDEFGDALVGYKRANAAADSSYVARAGTATPIKVTLKPVNSPPKLPQALAMMEREGLVDFSKYSVSFRSRVKQLIRTPQGIRQAAGTVPIDINEVTRRGLSAVEVGRLDTGLIPIRLDGRLLRNLDELRAVLRHEVAETEEILRFEGQALRPQSLQELLDYAHEAGNRAMLH